MRMTSNEGGLDIDWDEGAEFPDRDDAVFAVVYAKDLVPNLKQDQDTVGTLGEWIHWMQESIEDRREELEGMNEGESWSVVGIAIQKYSKNEDTENEVPIFNDYHRPTPDDFHEGGLIYRKSMPFDEINKGAKLGMSDEVLEIARESGLRADIDYFHPPEGSTGEKK